MSGLPPAAGKSSFDLIDREKFLSLIDLPQKSTVVDLACGTGKYSIAISGTEASPYTVYAVDLWEEGIDALNQIIADNNITNIRSVVADISKKIPLETDSADMCLMATVLHDLSKESQHATLREAYRVLKPDGILMIIEFKKIDSGPGPPVNIRLAELEVEKLAVTHDFKKISCDEIGEFNYVIKLEKSA
ncbi:MAG: class I SAM-dependent methyltransferase [Nitrospiraceae bacterium]|nr:MAG: class I SAM-dependent methyltransferase [Nitrospiraceae bacterium]